MTYKHILVAVDLSPSSQTLLEKAASMAQQSSSKLSLVFVDVNTVNLVPKDESEALNKLRTLTEQSSYPVEDAFVVIGDLHTRLSGIVHNSDIDLVVCGHHHDFMGRLFSSVPKLANAIEADLLVVYLAP